MGCHIRFGLVHKHFASLEKDFKQTIETAFVMMKSQMELTFSQENSSEALTIFPIEKEPLYSF